MFPTISDIFNVYHIPCFKNAILYGITSGTIISVLRIIFKVPIIKACHSGIATFCGVSIMSWEGCRYRRYMEKKNRISNEYPKKKEEII
ncbi:hypothetical protein PCANB_002462 [Pneumocystis canis]|nr:hypothetical protein PCK1_002528 [Pneumocystis canis]KAG5438742.1 hypothetical protein PCANB_002462 [Pneumocystis canis]